jgi:hypothetical protein
MRVISNKVGETIGYLVHNCVIQPDSLKVVGIVLGDVLYGNRRIATGKIIHHKLHDIEGNVVATLKDHPELGHHIRIDKQRITEELWQLMLEIESHNCGWIPEHANWSHQSLQDLLN